MIKLEKKDSFFLEELDPRMKLLFVILFSVLCFVSESQLVFAWECVLIVLLYFARGLFMQGIKMAGFLTIIIGLSYVAGCIPNENVQMVVGLVIFLMGRCSIFFVMGYWMAANMRVGDFTFAMQKMHMPKGMIITIAVVFRYLPTVKDEFRSIRNTMKLRGIALNAKNIIKHPVRTFEYAIVPLVIRSLTIADQLSASAMTRGLDLEKEKSCYRNIKLQVSDVLATVLVSILAVSGVLTEKYLKGGLGV